MTARRIRPSHNDFHDVGRSTAPGPRRRGDQQRRAATQGAANEPLAQRERAAVAVHEVGHAVAVALLGGIVTAVELAEDGTGSCSYSLTSDLADVDSQITYAGPFAEAVHRCGSRPGLAAITGTLARHEADREALIASGRPWPRGIESTVLEVWPEIVTLARELFAVGHLGQRQVADVLGLPLWSDRPVVASLTTRLATSADWQLRGQRVAAGEPS